jgi:hypothetical protein
MPLGAADALLLLLLLLLLLRPFTAGAQAVASGMAKFFSSLALDLQVGVLCYYVINSYVMWCCIIVLQCSTVQGLCLAAIK